MNIKSRVKSDTNRYAMMLVSFGVIQENMPLLREYLADWYGLIFVAVGVVVAVLREITTQPVTDL